MAKALASKKRKPVKAKVTEPVARPKFPRHSVEKALRIPQKILEQNAGKSCTPDKAASFFGVGAAGLFSVEIGSATKYGFLERPETGKIQPTALARQILKPQSPHDVVEGYRKAVLNATDFNAVYQHYRGENLPDDEFFRNTVVENFGISSESFPEFRSLFMESLESAQLLQHNNDKTRVLDISAELQSAEEASDRIKTLGKAAGVVAGESCFVMQPFAAPLGDYYEKIYKPAIEKAGLRAVRADAEIFGTGKIMDQVWSGINSARVLVAELTSRNPNVFYELGLAHALKKPVVLVTSREDDVPFDLQHIRVIHYDLSDPFWGSKLIEKVAENILSAIKNPEEAIFKAAL